MRFRASFNPQSLTRRLQNRARGFQQALPDQLRRAGRLVAVSLATSAQPYGTGGDALQAGATAVQRDIRRIYATPGEVYGAIKEKAGKQKADAFYATFKKDDLTAAKRLISDYAPRFSLAQIGQFDGGDLHRQRRNRRGRVPASQKPLLLVTNPAALRDYIKKEVGFVGFGKAGWANCTKVFADNGATRGLPRWVTRHKNAPALVSENYTGAVKTITLVNQVEYAGYLLSGGDKSEAVRIGIERLTKALITEEHASARANGF